MSIGKAIRAVFVACLFFIAVYFVGSQLLGPGVGDFSDNIINGYEYDYAGGNERAIIYRGGERPNKIVIDARVEGYRAEGDKLFVVRRPREIYKDGDLTKGRLLNECEHWVIDTKNHQIEKVEWSSEFQDLRCSGI